MSEIFFIFVLIFTLGCGIKGKPLPPTAATTQQVIETPAAKEKKK